MNARKRPRRALPVLAPSEQIRCDRLSATLSVGACTARWHKAQDRTVSRTNSPAWSTNEATGTPYISCRDCPEGRERAAANDDGRVER